MVVLSAELRFHISDARSLKDKRQVCRSLVDGARHKFNAAIAEVDTQDVHDKRTNEQTVNKIPKREEPQDMV